MQPPQTGRRDMILRYSLCAVIGIVLIFRIATLDQLEIQPWDEALYAVRIDGIVQHSAWWDQTAFAPGGLYSSAHAPLYIWLTAASVQLFGDSAFVLRLWSALFGVATVLLLIILPRDRIAGLFAGFTLATCTFFLHYAGQAQLDVCYTFFIVSGLYTWTRYESLGNRVWLAATGCAFGFALMSKIIVGAFLPLALGVYLCFRYATRKTSLRRAIQDLGIIIALGAAIAAPWHISMAITYGVEYFQYYFLFHIVQRSLAGVEANVQSLGPLFFANQIVVMLGAGGALALWRCRRLRHTIRTHSAELLAICAFLVPFAIFTVSATKLRTYAIPMLPPLSILAGFALAELWRAQRMRFSLAFAMVLTGVWAASQDLRLWLKSAAQTLDITGTAIAAFGVLAVFVALWRFKKQIASAGLIIAYCCAGAARMFVAPVDHYSSGIAEVAQTFAADSRPKLVYADALKTVINPQITYYFDGVDLGWRSDKTFAFIHANDAASTPIDSLRNAYIVIHWRVGLPGLISLDSALRRTAEPLLRNNEYRVYRY